MCEITERDQTKITVYHLSVDGTGAYFDTKESLLDAITNDLELVDQGGEMRIVVGEMTRAQFDELPEFEGY